MVTRTELTKMVEALEKEVADLKKQVAKLQTKPKAKAPKSN